MPPESVAGDEPSTPAFLMGWITTRSATASYDQLFHTRGGGLGAWNLTRHSDPEPDKALPPPSDRR